MILPTVADILDILIASILIYGLIVLIKQTRSKNIIGGIFMLIAIYLLAILLELNLLLSIFRLFLPVFFIAIVIIFQEDFRRFFEFLGILPSRYHPLRKGSDQSTKLANEIAQAAKYLTSKRMGAIIVIRGNESVERHLKGSIPLFGQVSTELLDSIFDKHSPGHDGAVIIDENIVTHFGAHLPLSQRTKELGGRGTRHAAALGLSEKTDALIIVVSEETRAISIVTNGRLKKLDKEDSLNRIVSGFYRSKFPEKKGSTWRNIIKMNSRDKIFAVAIAAVLWYLLNK